MLVAQTSEYAEAPVSYYNEAYSPYAGAGLLLNLLLAVAAATLLAKKGYGAINIITHLLFGLFCCGIGAFVFAVLAEDLVQQRKDAEVAERLKRLSRSRSRQEAASIRYPVRCEGCGEPNELANESCWSCGREMNHADGILTGKPRDPSNVTQQVSMSSVRIRVQCRACKKKFEGPKGRVVAVKGCPKCGASPFDYRLLPVSKRKN